MSERVSEESVCSQEPKQKKKQKRHAIHKTYLILSNVNTLLKAT